MNDSLDNEEIDVLEEYISENNLKITKQRRTVLKIFLECKNQVTVEELYNIALKTEPKIGLATVYRTLALLTRSGLALEMDFGDGQKRYESTYKSDHHDHMVCTECGKILEFNHPLIEKYQEEVAQEKNFKITSHKLALFGLCQDCK